MIKHLRFQTRKVNSNIPYNNSSLVFTKGEIGSLTTCQYRSPPVLLLLSDRLTELVIVVSK